MASTADYQLELQRVNLQFLELMRQWCMRDPAEAQVVFGISAMEVKALIDASVQDLRSVAEQPLALMRARALLCQLLTSGPGAPRACAIGRALHDHTERRCSL